MEYSREGEDRTDRWGVRSCSLDLKNWNDPVICHLAIVEGCSIAEIALMLE